ncbi:MAG: 50S ribosomal protein L22 [bacterium]|nr:50S ribosomal protein L22 [bacterium]
MEVKAYLRNLRMSPVKVRLMVNVVRGLSANDAQVQLQFSKRHAALPILKLLNSAIANAEHNFKLGVKDLYIKTIAVDGGATLKRWRPRAFGRAAPIRKRTAHVSIVLDQRMQEAVEVPTSKVATVAKKLIRRTKAVSAEGHQAEPQKGVPPSEAPTRTHAPKPVDPHRQGSRHDSRQNSKKA